MRPLALAAEIHLCVLKDGIQGIGIDVHYTNREIRRSLEVICSAMDAFQDATGEHGQMIGECRTFLQSSEHNDRWFEAGLGTY